MTPAPLLSAQAEEVIDSLTLGKRIRQLRSDAQLTLADLASSVGVATSHMSSLENGKREAKLSELQSVARAVGDAAGEAPVVGRAAKGTTRAAGSATRGAGRAVAGTTSKARRPRSADADSEDPPRRRTARSSGSGSSSGRAGSSSRSSSDSDSEGRAAPARRTARSSSGRSSESSSSSSSGSSGKGGSRNGRAPRSGGRATRKSEARADG